LIDQLLNGQGTVFEAEVRMTIDKHGRLGIVSDAYTNIVVYFINL